MICDEETCEKSGLTCIEELKEKNNEILSSFHKSKCRVIELTAKQLQKSKQLDDLIKKRLTSIDKQPDDKKEKRNDSLRVERRHSVAVQTDHVQNINNSVLMRINSVPKSNAIVEPIEKSSEIVSNPVGQVTQQRNQTNRGTLNNPSGDDGNPSSNLPRMNESVQFIAKSKTESKSSPSSIATQSQGVQTNFGGKFYISGKFILVVLVIALVVWMALVSGAFLGAYFCANGRFTVPFFHFTFKPRRRLVY